MGDSGPLAAAANVDVELTSLGMIGVVVELTVS
jgi:hypothetical protein